MRSRLTSSCSLEGALSITKLRRPLMASSCLYSMSKSSANVILRLGSMEQRLSMVLRNISE